MRLRRCYAACTGRMRVSLPLWGGSGGVHGLHLHKRSASENGPCQHRCTSTATMVIGLGGRANHAARSTARNHLETLRWDQGADRRKDGPCCQDRSRRFAQRPNVRAVPQFGISKRVFGFYAALVGGEPRMTDAALCTNVKLSSICQKRDRFKSSFAQGFCTRFFNDFGCWLAFDKIDLFCRTQKPSRSLSPVQQVENSSLQIYLYRCKFIARDYYAAANDSNRGD